MTDAGSTDNRDIGRPDDWSPGAGESHRLSRGGWTSGSGTRLHRDINCSAHAAGQDKAASEGKDTYKMMHCDVKEAFAQELKPCKHCWPKPPWDQSSPSF